MTLRASSISPAFCADKALRKQCNRAFAWPDGSTTLLVVRVQPLVMRFRNVAFDYDGLAEKLGDMGIERQDRRLFSAPANRWLPFCGRPDAPRFHLQLVTMNRIAAPASMPVALTPERALPLVSMGAMARGCGEMPAVAPAYKPA